MIRGILAVVEIAILTALIIATRCANYQDVFVAGNVYFVDGDCYARMTRVQMVREKPGLIIRHHAFENFPQGTTPHTTAPLDYLMIGLSFLLNPFTAHALDLAGAFVSPLLALLGGWFLWWWSRRMKFRYRWVMLILYAISPILVHGTELGRPDHQSLLILLVTVAICTEWSLQNLRIGGTPSDVTRELRGVRAWVLASAVAWAVAIWVSAYEPLVLFLILTATALVMNRRAGWILFAAIIAIAFAIEGRVPSFAILQSNGHLKNWASTIGELVHVSPMNPVWLNWCGFLLFVAPVLIWMSIRTPRNGAPGGRALPFYVLLVATYFLTIWQARWGYFFVLIFALALPALLAPIKSGAAVWIAVVLSMFPILRDWDERLWPNETQLAKRVEKRIESGQIRDLALSLRSPEVHPFLAPWWLSPSIAYWSGQPGVAGSSHESLNGIEDSARFFLSDDLQKAREILEKRRVAWVFAYDSDRVAQNSAAILNEPLPREPLCRVLDRTPSQAPPFLIFSAQNPTSKLYRVTVERGNDKKLFTQKRESVDRHPRVSHYYQMLKRFVPQKPAPPIREEPRNPVPDENHHFASREEAPPKPTIIDNPNPKPNPMADHGGKDILSSDVEIKGSIKFQKELLIDGKVEGDINSDGILTVGENAEIRGEIKTKSITVYGKVHGNITVTERCELKSKCVLQGDLKAARLVIEEGATFIGKSEVTTGAVSAKAAPRPEVVRSSEPIKAAFGVRA